MIDIFWPNELQNIQLQKYKQKTINFNLVCSQYCLFLNRQTFEILMLQLWFPSNILELTSGIGNSFSTSPSLQRLRNYPFAYLQFSGTMTSKIPCIQELMY